MDILILEDNISRQKSFKRLLIGNNVAIVDSTKSCIELLKNKTWDIIFLDHDLNGQAFVKSGPNTGFEVAEFMAENPQFKPKHIFCHSLNTDGVKNILKKLELSFEEFYKPYCWLDERGMDLLLKHLNVKFINDQKTFL